MSWIIQDWTGAVKFHGKQFVSFEDAEEFLNEYFDSFEDADAYYEENRGEFYIIEVK